MLNKKEIISSFLKHEVLELDWNVLNECIEKIESFRFNNNLFYTVEIHREGCRITRNWTTVKEKDFGWHQTGNKFLSTTNSICQFISNVAHAIA